MTAADTAKSGILDYRDARGIPTDDNSPRAHDVLPRSRPAPVPARSANGAPPTPRTASVEGTH